MKESYTSQGFVGGVSIEIFSQSRSDGYVIGRNSNERVWYAVRPDCIEITSNEKRLRFRADRDGYAVSFIIRTKGYQNQKSLRHPDLYAADLIEASLDFFEQFRHITQVIAVWKNEQHLDDNYAYVVNHLSSDPDESEYRLIASQTWTGRALTEAHGFECQNVYEVMPHGKNPHRFEAIFKRE